MSPLFSSSRTTQPDSHTVLLSNNCASLSGSPAFPLSPSPKPPQGLKMETEEPGSPGVQKPQALSADISDFECSGGDTTTQSTHQPSMWMMVPVLEGSEQSRELALPCNGTGGAGEANGAGATASVGGPLFLCSHSALSGDMQTIC